VPDLLDRSIASDFRAERNRSACGDAIPRLTFKIAAGPRPDKEARRFS
jgi:hypothetical protein